MSRINDNNIIRRNKTFLQDNKSGLLSSHTVLDSKLNLLFDAENEFLVRGKRVQKERRPNAIGATQM